MRSETETKRQGDKEKQEGEEGGRDERERKKPSDR